MSLEQLIHELRKLNRADKLRAVRLVFAWTQAENAPAIFGQMNFFLEFDVCFYRSQNMFDV